MSAEGETNQRKEQKVERLHQEDPDYGSDSSPEKVWRSMCRSHAYEHSTRLRLTMIQGPHFEYECSSTCILYSIKSVTI